MDELDCCRIADTLALTWAAALICGSFPNKVVSPDESGSERYRLRRSDEMNAEYWDDAPEKFDAALQALVRAVERGTLKAEKRYPGRNTHVRHVDGKPEGFWEPAGPIDPAETTVTVDDLKQWLITRGVRAGFFFPEGTDAADYLDRRHPRYAPKLAATVMAWQAVADPGKKSPRQALERWLREHAAEFDLTDDNGNPVEKPILECARIANWEPAGGAPKSGKP